MPKNQYIVFKLDDNQFGVSIMKVREIITYQEATPVPDTPDYIKGLLNHRDNVIPLIDLKNRLNLGEFIPTNDSRIIIITIDGKDIGFLVDEASQNIVLSQKDIDITPKYLGVVDKKYITGVGKLEDNKLLILLDLEKILSEEEIDEVKKIK